MRIQASYPTPQHEAAAGIISSFFSTRADVEAIILTGSCARGKATRDSCLDILVFESREIAKKAQELEWMLEECNVK
jgi:predicted nucleotidyltransferase